MNRYRQKEAVKEDDQQPFKNGLGDTGFYPAARGDARPTMRMTYYDLAKDLAYQDAADLQELRFRRIDGGWQVIVKVVRDREYQVAFLTCPRFEDALQTLSEYAGKGLLVWRQDKYPPKG